MAFTIRGYVLEPIRVGQSNSTFTQTPDNLISDQGAFDAAYPASEDEPRTEYLVQVTQEGSPALLEFARFGWTKNEVIARFGYEAQRGSFTPLPGSAPTEVGTLSTDANTNRLKVRPPVQAAPLAAAPYRLAVGSSGSGVAFTVTIVANESGFGSPSSGSVELALDSGLLNWNTGDLTTLSGQRVRFQQQQFFDYKESTGNIGAAPISLTDPVLILNPLPGPGQIPQLRFGYGFYVAAVEVGAFSPTPASGTVEWLTSTGELKFNPTDASTNSGTPVYYDGVMFDIDLELPSQSLGTVLSPSNVSGLPSTGADVFFALPNYNPYYRFPSVEYVTSFSSGKSGVVQVKRSTGAVNFSNSDESKYGAEQVKVYFGDLPIERGVSVRLLRTPVNLDGALQTVKDASELYTVTGATLSDPIIAFSQVPLPSVPINDPSYPLTVQVFQGQGSFTSDDLPDLNVPVPPVGLGYYIDYDLATLFFAQRKDQQLVLLPQASSQAVLPDPLVLSGNLTLELETAPDSGLYTPLTLGSDAVIDPLSGVVTLTATNDAIAQSLGSISGDVLTDLTAQFVVDGVQPGYLVVIANTAAKGVYRVLAVNSATSLQLDTAAPSPVASAIYTIYESSEILADRYFGEVVLLDPSTSVERIRLLGAAVNSPRLNVPTAYADSSSFTVGSSSGAGLTVVQVPNDSSFTSPLAGTVELSVETGNLNFSASDLGASIYWARVLVANTDYVIQAGFGLVQLVDRMLADEEARVTYTQAPPSTTPATLPGAPLTEAARFIVRKEVTQSHPAPTSTLFFNMEGRPVASEPAPAVFRGGRPQKLGIQCTVDSTLSTITFLADDQLTDALPHGATVAPNERVYIDYFVTKAVGGESTFTVLHPPMHSVAVNIQESDEDGNPNNKFVVYGDQTSAFPAGCLLRIEQEQVYLIGSSTWDSGTNETTVTLAGWQVFQDTFITPKVYVSSGSTPLTTYYAPELASYEAVARGSNTFLVAGDKTVTYRPGTVVLFQDAGPTFIDFLSVSGAEYDADANRTKVMLTANALRQYALPSQFLSYSIRPVFEPPTTETQTSKPPVLNQPYLVYRRVAGSVGEILTQQVDYTIDDSGRVVFMTALGPDEEFGALYTGQTVANAGVHIRASYTAQITPSALNGLLGQKLLADYTVRSPDTFFCRVETLTNFRGEYAAEIASDASSGSSGPQTSNISQPELFEQGRKSLYFDERHLANQDYIARSTLLFYNDLANYLDDYRRSVDGTAVGNNDGKLLFDGSTGHTHPPDPVDNQIDDTIKVSNAPYTITFPPYAVTSIGTYKKYYLPGPLSRFYPTAKNFFAVSAVTPSTVAGDEVVDTRSVNVTQVSNLHTRAAWGIVTESTQFSGSNLLKVDFASGSEPGFDAQAEAYARPPFKNGMKCLIQARSSSFINGPGSPITITAVGSNQLSISGLSGTVNVGDTVYRDPADASAQAAPDTLTNYVLGRDYSFNGEPGQLTYIAPNGVIPPGDNTPLIANQALAGKITLANVLTAPLEIPALFGGIEDDDGDLSFPIQTPDPDSEQNGYLYTENKLIATGTGLLRTLTTDPFVSTGDLITLGINQIDDPAISPATIQQRDLVRILDGLNGLTTFRRVASAGVGFLTVDVPFASNDTGFSYEVTISPNVASGLTTGGTTTQLTDTFATLLPAVKVGYTVVFPAAGRRRQIRAVTNTTIDFTPAVPLLGAGASYRVENSLATYRDIVSFTDYTSAWEAVLTSEAALYSQQQVLLQAAIELALTDIVAGSVGSVSIGQALFTDLSATFLADNVQSSHYVFIQSGLIPGVYKIQSVDSQTQLTITAPFSVTESGISYRVVKLFGLSEDSVGALFDLYQDVASLGAPIPALLAKMATVSVSGSDPAYANSLLGSDLDAREAQVAARLAAIPAISTQLDDILANTDKVYDKRYVWVDARINLEDGLLVLYETAVRNRIKAQADVLKQLTKLLAVEGS